jgi:putative spermidine/putrescine transport system ATP-binding protein
VARLILQGLRKRFGEVIALQGLDLTIESGEFVTFLGPSGCGKTTALRIVAGFEQPDAGRVLLANQDITRVPASQRDMGMVFQAYSLFPNLSALENVAFGLRVRRVHRRERIQRAGDLLDLVGLSSAARRFPHQLSGGQQQRVALARALAIQPRVLLLDEPLSALDARVRAQLREEIRRIQSALGITALFVTHDQEEALSISDRVVVLSQGQIEQVGTPAEIYGEPHTVFVAEFVGTMNRIAGTVAPRPGFVVCPAGNLRSEAAAGRAVNEPILLLIRPETIELTALADGRPPAEGGLRGRVTAHTFLGAVTRLNVATDAGEIKVDVGSTRALALAEGSPVYLSWDPSVPRLISAATPNQAFVPRPHEYDQREAGAAPPRQEERTLA